MQIIRHEKRIDKNSRLAKLLVVLGMAILIAGLVVSFMGESENLLLVQLITLPVGWLVARIGIHYSNIYIRKPRPDLVLDGALKKFKDGRLYHFAGPAHHLLLTKSGPIILNTLHQTGKISADGNRWQQRGIGLQRFTGQALGNPSKQATNLVGALANFLRKNAPEIEDVPVGVVNVFISDNIASLDVNNADIPSLHHKKLLGFLRQKTAQMEPLAKDDYQALRDAFDKEAGI